MTERNERVIGIGPRAIDHQKVTFIAKRDQGVVPVAPGVVHTLTGFGQEAKNGGQIGLLFAVGNHRQKWLGT